MSFLPFYAGDAGADVFWLRGAVGHKRNDGIGTVGVAGIVGIAGHCLRQHDESGAFAVAGDVFVCRFGRHSVAWNGGEGRRGHAELCVGGRIVEPPHFFEVIGAGFVDALQLYARNLVSALEAAHLELDGGEHVAELEPDVVVGVLGLGQSHHDVSLLGGVARGVVVEVEVFVFVNLCHSLCTDGRDAVEGELIIVVVTPCEGAAECPLVVVAPCGQTASVGFLAVDGELVVESFGVELVAVFDAALQRSACGFVLCGFHFHGEALSVDALDFVAPEIDGFIADGSLGLDDLRCHVVACLRGAGALRSRFFGAGFVPVLAHGDADADAVARLAAVYFNFFGTGREECCRDESRGNSCRYFFVVHFLWIFQKTKN